MTEFSHFQKTINEIYQSHSRQIMATLIRLLGDFDKAEENEAIQLMSKHPSLKMGGTFEIRPSADLSALFAESKKRREMK